MAYHPPMFQRITGHRLTDDEILHANKQWTNSQFTPRIKLGGEGTGKFQGGFTKLLQNMTAW